jgi:hypothetical protein
MLNLRKVALRVHQSSHIAVLDLDIRMLSAGHAAGTVEHAVCADIGERATATHRRKESVRD